MAQQFRTVDIMFPSQSANILSMFKCILNLIIFTLMHRTVNAYIYIFEQTEFLKCPQFIARYNCHKIINKV